MYPNQIPSIYTTFLKFLCDGIFAIKTNINIELMIHTRNDT